MTKRDAPTTAELVFDSVDRPLLIAAGMGG